MSLQRHLFEALPTNAVGENDKGHYAILESADFRLNYSILGQDLRIHYLRVTERGKGFGNVVVEAVVTYCRAHRLVPYAIMPEEQFKNFWRRNDFEPTEEDDELWIHEDWAT